MRPNRRQLLRTATAVAVGAGLAGCSGDDEPNTATEAPTDAGTTQSGETDDGDGGESASVGASAAVSAEWTAMRARLDDAYALGLAGMTDDGAAVADRTFERFEHAEGEYGAHEFLEATSEANYGGFEGGIVDLRDALADGDVEAAAAGWADAHANLREAQVAAVGEAGADALGVLRFGAAVNDVELLAAAGETDAAATVAGEVQAWLEDAPEHDALESADGDAYAALEGAMADAESAASGDDLGGVRDATDAALEAAVAGAKSIASAELATAGHLATYQAQGWDAAALAGVGGPATDYAHAAVLNGYRARVFDAAWLSDRGATEAAQAMADDVFAHFEADERGYHEALEGADHAAYEGFETGLEDLSTAIGEGDADGVHAAVATVDEYLLTGVEALAGSTGATLLEAAFFRARLADARERYLLGDAAVAAGVVGDLLERFEADEAGFHEAFEGTDHEAYESFESSLGSLRTAMENGDDGGVESAATAAMAELLGYETAAGSTAQVSAAESSYLTARGFDAAGLAALGEGNRAASITDAALGYFEGGAGGFHEALEEADHGIYESFEGDLGAVGAAASEGGDAYGAATTFHADAVGAAYAVVAAAGGSFGGAAATVVDDAFGSFEANQGDVHETLEDADEGAYEGFEHALDALSTALQDGGDVHGAADAYADATLRAQFAVVGALDDAPVDEGGESEGPSVTYEGGPNVQSGVPDDADQVVDMTAVAFEPAELTVSVGDTVAWTHAGGEPHSVTALEGELPSGADYWASGDFDAESAAREGWDEESGTVQGAVQSGESYVHTFETAGTHEYVCIPHERAGMVGTVVVEE